MSRSPISIRFLTPLILLGVALLLGGCGEPPKSFHIIAGSEEKSFAPIVRAFCLDHGVSCQIDYMGSLDIGLLLADDETPDADAVWPASSIWLAMYDLHRRVRNARSIASTPVILGVRMSKARELGWIGRAVHMSDILAAVDAHKLSFLMTSATQSNSGASAYLAMLAASFGKPDRLDPRALDDRQAWATVKALLRGVARSSGSSGWLEDLYMGAAMGDHPFDAMWNYEAVIKETNDHLRTEGGELLYAIYPADGTTFADVPLGYVDRGQGESTKNFFLALQSYLLSAEIQAEVASLGRRPVAGGAKPLPAERDWNFDPSRQVRSISLPAPGVIARALTLYQEVLRKPSLTAMCLDYSDSMHGKGETMLKSAMRTLFDPAEATRSLIEWTAEDRIFILPFDSHVREVESGNGTSDSQATLLSSLKMQSPGGGKNIFACAERALAAMDPLVKTDHYLPAVVILTNGRPDRNASNASWQHESTSVPIFGVTFGPASSHELEQLAEATHARVFSSGTDLGEAFRSVRGYN